MAKPAKARRAESFRLVSLAQIAKELDRTPHQTRKALGKLGFTGIVAKQPEGEAIIYNAKALEVIKGLYSMPHRSVREKVDDWLADFITTPPPTQGETDE